jgi:signal transduction histidine kinase
MSVRTRLLSMFGLVTGIMLVPSAFAVSRLGQLSGIAIEGRTAHAAAVTGLGRMQSAVIDLDRLERSFIATGDADLGRRAAAQLDSLRTQLEAFRASPYGGLATEVAPILEEIASLTIEVDAQVDRGRLDAATTRFETLLSRFDLADRGFRAMADSVDTRARAELSRADDMLESARTQTLYGVGVALILALLFTGLTTHWLTAPLRRLGRAMAAVADGVLRGSDDLAYDRDDEIGDLFFSFDVMTRKLAALDRKKSEFLGMVSHELKTPINVITAYAEILRDELGDVAEYHRDMLGSVGNQSREMARRLSRLMDLSRLEAGTYQLQFDPVPLRCFMADIRSTYRRFAEEKNVSLEVEISDCATAEVVMDGDIVRDEVLGNLILNAIRHTPGGGRVEVSLDAHEHGIHFLVADTGPGIPEEHRDHIFRKHYMADRALAVGSGLGLAIAKEMVELHCGIIALEDTLPGWGARFRVCLPVAPFREGLELPTECLMDPAANAGAATLSFRSGQGTSQRKTELPRAS